MAEAIMDVDVEQVEEAAGASPALETGPKRIAVMMAHPDDPDFSCAGTCARWADEGHHITYVIITNGDKGSDDRNLSSEDLVAMRQREQRAAAAILGVQDVVFMGKEDCMLAPTIELRRDLVRVIRRIKPDIVVCGDPTVFYMGSEYINHPDHRAAAQAVMDAIFPAARNHRIFPELLAEGLEPHRVLEVYLSSPKEADVWIDITPYMDRKIAALRAHAGQMGDWDPDEPIRGWNREDGKRAVPPVEYAEDFRRFVLE